MRTRCDIIDQGSVRWSKQLKLCLVNLTGSSNEGQFAFTVESIVMAQKLRGTLTYVIKVLFSSPCFAKKNYLVLHRYRVYMLSHLFTANGLSCYFFPGLFCCRMTKVQLAKRWIFLCFCLARHF